MFVEPREVAALVGAPAVGLRPSSPPPSPPTPSWASVPQNQYLADWLAWLGVSTIVGSGDGLLGGGGGLSGSSASSRASSLMCTAGSGQDCAPGTLPPEDTAAEQGGCDEELGPAEGVGISRILGGRG